MASFCPELYQTIVAIVVEARKAAGISQRELAESFGQPDAFVTSYETGERLLDVGEFVAACRAIGVDPCEVLKKVSDHD